MVAIGSELMWTGSIKPVLFIQSSWRYDEVMIADMLWLILLTGRRGRRQGVLFYLKTHQHQ